MDAKNHQLSLIDEKLPVEATRSQHPSSAMVKNAAFDSSSPTGNSLDL